MTKQQIVAQLCAAKISGSGFFPGIDDLKNYGGLADKIIEMFPEPEYSITTDGTIYKFSDNTLSSIAGGNLA